jgi:hypothetical protein
VRKIALVFAMCLCASACIGGATSDRLTFRAGRFSIEPLENCQTVAMAMPMTDGFTPNVTVQIQPYPGTVDDYVALSKQQFTQVGFKLIREARRGKSGWVVEYRGTMADRSLHWYAKAELRQKKAYLATAAALESQWPSASRKLKACVDSLQVTQ